ncbi:hypothetical protein L6164_034905 [Bauhinia variegata]|uniref:Uncharacterized protein n=1 Tax=Bauhinia variegata TaxID=167791 RepID=A0ACB9KXN3_BAUVA|nr:hypothetical protein L6164_034905 [Bauhinia variegata]
MSNSLCERLALDQFISSTARRESVCIASIKSHTSRATDVEIQHDGQDDITGKGGRFKWLKNDTFRAVFVNTVAAAVALLWCNTYDVLRQ